MILTPLRWLGTHGTKLVAASIFVGLVFPDLASLARPLFPVSVVCMLTIAMIRIDPAAAVGYVAKPAFLLAGTAWMIVATPCILAGLYWFSPPSPAIALGIIFWATAPATVSSPGFSQLVGLNGTLSLAFLLTAMLAAPFVIPGLTEILTSAEIAVTTGGLMMRLGLLIGGAAALAFVFRRLLGTARVAETGPVFDGLNVVFMTLFAVAAMDSVADTMAARPWHVINLIVLTAGLSVGCIALATAVFWKAGRVAAATLGFSNGNRNMALVLSALAGNVHEDTWLFFAVAQFPIYLLPLLMQPVYGRLIGLRSNRASTAE